MKIDCIEVISFPIPSYSGKSNVLNQVLLVYAQPTCRSSHFHSTGHHSSQTINDKFRSFAKGARLAVDVVQHKAAIERAIHHACGNALVCDTMEVARYVCYEKGQEVKGCIRPSAWNAVLVDKFIG
jgi:SMC proteins Flexible Hinge Domain